MSTLGILVGVLAGITVGLVVGVNALCSPGKLVGWVKVGTIVGFTVGCWIGGWVGGAVATLHASTLPLQTFEPERDGHAEPPLVG